MEMPSPGRIAHIVRSVSFGTVGVIIGLAIAVTGWRLVPRAQAASAPAAQPSSKHAVVDEKLALSSPVHDKAVKRAPVFVRRFVGVAPPAAPASPAPAQAPTPSNADLDKLGDAQLNRPF
jgi:hypothetical protein